MSLIEGNTEEKILFLLREGDEYAYELVFRRYYISLCGFATRFVQQPEIAEEIVQHTFLKLWEKRQELHISVSLKSYLFRAVYNRCHNHLAHLKVKNTYLQFAQNTAAQHRNSPDSIINNLTYKELDEKITGAIERLPEHCRIIFKMSRFDGMKYSEIAAALHLSVKTVETQISRALYRMRKELAVYLENG